MMIFTNIGEILFQMIKKINMENYFKDIKKIQDNLKKELPKNYFIKKFKLNIVGWDKGAYTKPIYNFEYEIDKDENINKQ